MGVEVAAAAAIAGAGLQAYGQYKSAQDQAWAARQQAKLKRAQANEIRERLALETKQIARKGENVKANQALAFAKGGVALGAGAPLIAMEDTNSKIADEIEFTRRDALFRATQIEQGAKYEEKAAGQYQTAGNIGAAGTLLGAAGRLYNK